MKTFVLLAGILGSACAATVGTGGVIYVPRDAATTCSTHCNAIGLALNSVVIMAGNVGCVCSAVPGPPDSSAGASAGGMAALMMAEEEQQSQRSSNTSPSRSR